MHKGGTDYDGENGAVMNVSDITFTQLFVTITVSFRSAAAEKNLTEEGLNPVLANCREYRANMLWASSILQLSTLEENYHF